MSCTFVQTHRMHDSKSDPNANYQLWVTLPCWRRFIDCNQGTSGGVGGRADSTGPCLGGLGTP